MKHTAVSITIVLILAFLLVQKQVLADNFKVNKMSYTLISFYKCNNTLNLTEQQFDKLMTNVQNNEEFEPFYGKWGRGNKFLISNEEFRAWLNFSHNSEVYITLTPTYWLMTYSLYFNESENYDSFDQRMDSLKIDEAGAWEHLRRNIDSVCNDHELSILMYNVYDYNGSINCLKNLRSIADCENDLDYKKLTQRFGFPLITEDRLHESCVNEDIVILDKKHLGDNFDDGISRDIIISKDKRAPSIEYGLFRNTCYSEQLEYLYKLRQVPSETNNIRQLNNQFKSENTNIESLLNQIREDLSTFIPIKIFFIKKEIQSISKINEKLENQSLIINEKSSVFDDLKGKSLDTIFYVKYYSKFYNLYVPRFDDAVKEYRETLQNTKVLVNDVWSTIIQLKAIAFSALAVIVAVIIASIALIWDIVARWREKVENREYRENIKAIIEEVSNSMLNKLNKIAILIKNKKKK